MKNAKFPITISEAGVSARIRKVSKNKGRSKHTYYVVDYVLLGNRKQVWRANLDDAKAAASEVCLAIANGQQLTLELRNHDRIAYIRATTALADARVPIDTACREYADALAVLNNRASLIEAARFYVQTHSTEIPRVPVSQAVEEMIEQARRDGKSPERIHQLESYLNRFTASFNCSVSDLTSPMLSDFIVGMRVGERTKKNCRDVLGAFCKYRSRSGATGGPSPSSPPKPARCTKRQIPVDKSPKNKCLMLRTDWRHGG